MQALELLQLAKRHVSGLMLDSGEIKLVALAIIKLRLSESIS